MKLRERFDSRSLRELEGWLKEKQARLRESAQGVMSTCLATRSADSVEWATETLHQEIQVAFLESVSLHLAQIDGALERLANGGYGICHGCGESIGLARLRVMPFALRCTECQSRTELHASHPAKVSRPR